MFWFLGPSMLQLCLPSFDVGTAFACRFGSLVLHGDRLHQCVFGTTTVVSTAMVRRMRHAHMHA